MNDFNFACGKCPRTFKLEEFYEKHQKVHELKRQHRCHVCGFVYGAAKGLEGHMKTHESERQQQQQQQLSFNPSINTDNVDSQQTVAATRGGLAIAASLALASAPGVPPTVPSEPPIDVDFHFLNPRGVLARANVPMTAPFSKTPKEKDATECADEGLKVKGQQHPQEPAKVASPAGTGNYEVYDAIPEISDSAGVYQNESGFFVCQICTREFSGLNSLKKHVPIHTRRIQHRCDSCGHTFGKKEYLLDHLRKHTGEVSPICEVCGQTFNKSLKLKEHFKLHRNVVGTSGNLVNHRLPFRCHICKGAFPRSDLLGIHLNAAHAEKNIYKCDICPATFGDVRGKNHHMYNEHQRDAFHQKCVWCPVCNQGFTRHYNLKVHMYKSHGKEYVENNFTAEELASLTKASPPPHTSSALSVLLHPCGMCEKRFSLKPELYNHLESVHGVLMVDCASCDEKFVDVKALTDHVTRQHPGHSSPGSSSSSNNNNKKHPPVVIGTRKRKPGPASKTNAPLEVRATSTMVTVVTATTFCHKCGMLFSDRQGLEAHLFAIHGLTPVQHTNRVRCEYCPQGFPRQDLLDAHVRSKHSNLSKRTAQMRDALGLMLPEATTGKQRLPDDLPTKRARLHDAISCLQQQDKHTKETDAMKPGLLAARAEAQAVAVPAVSLMPASQEVTMTVPSSHSIVNPTQELQQPSKEAAAEISSDDEDVRYEAITEAFLFEGRVIHPCYVVLPFVTEQDIQEACGVQRFKGSAAITDFQDDDDDDDDDGDDDDDDEEETPLTIDESAVEDDHKHVHPPHTQESLVMQHLGQLTPNPPQNTLSHSLLIKQPLPQSPILTKQPTVSHYNAEDIKLPDKPDLGFYPAISDYSLPFSLTSMWKKNADIMGVPLAQQQVELMECVERMKKYNGSVVGGVGSGASDGQSSTSPSPSPPAPATMLQESMNVKKSSPPSTPPSNSSSPNKSPRKPAPNDNAMVSDYEVKIQNDAWPLKCVKCDIFTINLDNFNLHMNDHWSEDKCCPVCGLLINSKRFNFKQHLKIHTGEKPFVCNICSRSFRQKAHMVKHVTTHRTIPTTTTVPNNNVQQQQVAPPTLQVN